LNNQQTQFLYLTTVGWKTGKQHSLEIWFVEHNKRYYIMSERRDNSHWVQNIMHNSTVSFTVNHKTFEGNARIVDQNTESKLSTEVSNLMNAKYGWDEGLIVELLPG
jgi:deazaflavin-dependent oxidoreductase (nitroreductase family)